MDRREERKIIFFDGVCGLCNSTVDFLLRRKSVAQFKFAPLQGQTASELLTAEDTQTLGSIVYLRKGELKYRSTAVIWILHDLGSIWKVSIALFLFPLFIRDLVYNWVGRNRYKWFGKKESCRLPTKEELRYFLS